MRDDQRWVIVDTETDGLHDPIHVVELSAQLMEGYQTVGEPFRMLLNHNVPIPAEAVAIHGYSEEFLRRYGHDPTCVHTAFRQYVQSYPIISHNLSYDWNRCLEPEWARLGVPAAGARGFCGLMLARRLIYEAPNYRLEALKKCFGITARSHQARSDVLTLVRLFSEVYRPRLISAGLADYDSVAAFAKRTPVTKCLDLIRGGIARSEKLPLKDEWYFVVSANNARGPLPACEVAVSADSPAYYVWREGMRDWACNQECPEFLQLTAARVLPAVRRAGQKTTEELIGICRGLIADGQLTTAEVRFLNSWLEDFGPKAEWPASQIAESLERILEDGKVSKSEKDDLKNLIDTITGPALRLVEPASPAREAASKPVPADRGI